MKKLSIITAIALSLGLSGVATFATADSSGKAMDRQEAFAERAKLNEQISEKLTRLESRMAEATAEGDLEKAGRLDNKAIKESMQVLQKISDLGFRIDGELNQ